MLNNMWEIYDGYYLPMGLCNSWRKGEAPAYGLDVYSLKLAAKGNPYTVFMSAYTLSRNRCISNRQRNRSAVTQDKNKQRYSRFSEILSDLRDNVPEYGDAGGKRVAVVKKVESIDKYQRIVSAALDGYIALELDKEGMFDVPDRLGIPRDTWLGAWRLCVAAMPDRLRTVVRDMSVKEYRRSAPPVDWYKFIDQWGRAYALSKAAEQGTAAVTEDTMPEVPEPPQEPQVITDHTITDEVMPGKRLMHNTAVTGILEFGMQFDADADVLAACIRLLPQKIGRLWSSDLSVRCNALVARVTMDNLGEGYPIAESLNIEALKQVAADVDDLHRRVTMLVKTVDAVRGGVDLF